MINFHTTDSQPPDRSLIAAFLGNVVGALFVAIPAVYFFLGDYDCQLDSRKLQGIEEGLNVTGSRVSEIRMDQEKDGVLQQSKRDD